MAYATNQLHLPDSTKWPYITLFDQHLRLGIATVRIGKDGVSADDLHAASTATERQLAVPLFLAGVRQDAVLETRGPESTLTPEAAAFFDQLNRLLERSRDPDITVYLHGAKNNFYRSSAQAAQYAHFTGRNSVVVFFPGHRPRAFFAMRST